MNQDSRVLSRTNARELTIDEAGQVAGGIQTAAPCTLSFDAKLDGPPADCSGA